MKNAIAYSFICLSLSSVNAEKDKEIKVHIKKYKNDPNDRIRLYIEQNTLRIRKVKESLKLRIISSFLKT